jgi:hypothetical protein
MGGFQLLGLLLQGDTSEPRDVYKDISLLHTFQAILLVLYYFALLTYRAIEGLYPVQ